MDPFSLINQLMESTSPKVKNLAKIAGFGGGALVGHHAAHSLGFGELGSDVVGGFLGALGARGMDTTKDRKLRLAKAGNTPLAEQKYLDSRTKCNWVERFGKDLVRCFVSKSLSGTIIKKSLDFSKFRITDG
jgi:hypothetical protein